MITSVAMLVALTEEAELALAGKREVSLVQFPFRVGRERRRRNDNRTPDLERRSGVTPPLNSLYLVESENSHALHISAEHFAIQWIDDGFVLVDRGSACGTIVAGGRIGGNRQGGQTELRDGDEIVVGTSRSPYVFRFAVSTAGS